MKKTKRMNKQDRIIKLLEEILKRLPIQSYTGTAPYRDLGGGGTEYHQTNDNSYWCEQCKRYISFGELHGHVNYL